VSGGAHVDHSNKPVALLISVLALVLAFSETLGKAAQTSALNDNIEAANLWSFYQAKTIRMTAVRIASESAESMLGSLPEKLSPAVEKRIEDWRKTAARYDSEPDTQEGRKELAARAKAAEARRNHAMAAYHYYELSSAAVQIAIVLASASIITAIPALVWIAGTLGVLGVLGCVTGYFWPTAIHLF
jgi:hypothetical protein